MDSFWLNHAASLEDARRAQTRAAAAQPGAEAASPFLAQIDQVLGNQAAPDPEFFIDTWTVGIEAASENLLRRQQEEKRRKQDMRAWTAFPSFASWHVATTQAPLEMGGPVREARADVGSMSGVRWHRYEETLNWQAGGGAVDVVGPLTLESACRVLGVAATSTRKQIKAAYRKLASRYHPDRLAQSGASEQKLAGDRMAAVNEAYRLLCAGLAARP